MVGIAASRQIPPRARMGSWHHQAGQRNKVTPYRWTSAKRSHYCPWSTDRTAPDSIPSFRQAPI